MEKNQIIEKLEDEVKKLENILAKRQPIICLHTVCSECQKKQFEQDIEDNILQKQIASKKEFINQIKGE